MKKKRGDSLTIMVIIIFVAIMFMAGVYIFGEAEIFNKTREFNFNLIKMGQGQQADDSQQAEQEGAYQNLDDYWSQVNRYCQTDADCMVKDVGNCCGYYPQCVNSQAKTDSDFVRSFCAKESLSGICGFPEISACLCVNNRCENI